MREIGGLIFETPTQHDYEAGIEVRSLLSTAVMEEIDGRLAVTDVDSNGQSLSSFGSTISPNSERQAAHSTAEEYAMARGSQQSPTPIPAFPVFREEVQSQGRHKHLRGERGSPLDMQQDLRVLLSMVARFRYWCLFSATRDNWFGGARPETRDSTAY